MEKYRGNRIEAGRPTPRPSILFFRDIEELDKPAGAKETAFALFARRDLRCDVLEFWSAKDVDVEERLRPILERGFLALAVCTQDWYHSEEDLERSIAETKELVGESVPIVAFPSWGNEDLVKVGDNVYRSQPHSKKLHAFIEQLRDNNLGLLNGKRIQAAQEFDNLVKAYEANHPDDDHMLGTPDDNTKAVAEYLRCRLLGYPLIVDEFDRVIQRKVLVEQQPEDAFQKDLERIKGMNDEEKQKLMDILDQNQGLQVDETGYKRMFRQSMGFYVHGFAIDSVTLKYVMTQGTGVHHGAASHWLARSLEAYEAIKRGQNFRDSDEEEYVEDRVFFTGLAHSAVEGFTTPIVAFKDLPSMTPEEIEDLKRVGSYLISQRLLVPIDRRGNILDKSYKPVNYDD